jgi:RHS repeat-associated protein
VGKKIKVYTAGASTLTTYYFAGGSYEVRDDGTTTTTIKYYAFAGQTIAMATCTGGTCSAPTYFLTDHLGSIVAVTNASGTLVSQQRYLPFGEVRTDVGNITETDFGYTGQRDVPNLGLMDYRARFYDSVLGRFVQPDTITPGGPQGLNRYSYGFNNPIKSIDPDGHKPRPPRHRSDSDGGFISIGFTVSLGPRELFWTGSIDLVWNNKGQVALFASPLVEHDAVDAKEVIFNDEKCSEYPCITDTDPKFITPTIGFTVIAGNIEGEEFGKDINKYGGPFNVGTLSIGFAAFEVFNSVDPETGVPNSDIIGAGAGFSIGYPSGSGGMYSITPSVLSPKRR